ncbi:methyl-accepting chemotaxis protein [Acuticoccus mangrovi]|uniref:HAMP domain-containing protein n=1 Tax=Acuticoccus mangrovi TaxID=2796142 RepID=A0A934IQW2_9HYPH|nr:methyl-accepting chemotaxis protein [Acuticoccus mangrovi]MBJ3775959.1 HAMP domain-containing protein [Acuticoccus mangrovi]
MADGRSPRFINNIGISWKLSFMVALLVGLFVVVAVGAHHSIDRVDALFATYRGATGKQIFAHELEENTFAARFSVAEYVADLSDAKPQEAKANIARLQEQATEAGAFLSGDAKDEEEVGLLQTKVADYARQFDAVVALQSKRDTQLKELAGQSGRIHGRIDLLIRESQRLQSANAMLHAAAVKEASLLAEIAAMDFITDPTTSGGRDRAIAQVANARVALGRYRDTAGRSERITELDRALLTYQDHIAQAAETVQLRTDLVNGPMQLLAGELVSIARSIDGRADNLQLQVDAASDGEMAQTRDLLFYLAVVATIAAVLVGIYMVRSVTAPIGRLTQRMAALASGDTEFTIRNRNSRDEFGRMWSALRSLLETSKVAYLRARMIEQIPLAVMVADPDDDFKITFMNEATVQQLEKISDLLPCPIDDIIGRSIDVFHTNPAHHRAILSDPTRLPWKATINLGGREYLNLNISAVYSRNGHYVGTLLTWGIVTAQVSCTRSFETNIKATVEQIGTTFRGMHSQVRGIVESVEATQGQLNSGAAAVTEASSNVQMVASAAEQLASSITEISERLARSTQRASEAATETASVAKRAQELATASERITEVVEAISEIAGKTNLLALNATIEAASAGEAGKGFAVVAQEVKNLAAQTARATEEVAQQTESIQAQVHVVVKGITEVSQVIEEIRETFVSVAAAAEEQQAATHEITVNAQHAADGVGTANSTIREVEGLSTSNLDAAHLLIRAAEELSQANDNLSRGSSEFLDTMKKAL